MKKMSIKLTLEQQKQILDESGLSFHTIEIEIFDEVKEGEGGVLHAITDISGPDFLEGIRDVIKGETWSQC